MDPKSCGELGSLFGCFSSSFLSFFSQQIEEFRKHFESILASIKSLKENLANTSTMRASEIEQTMKICSSTYADTQKSIKALLDNGEFNYFYERVKRLKRNEIN